jgi:hypothetical protein
MKEKAMTTMVGTYLMVWTYLAYAVISVAITIWVARTLHKNGRIFLVDAFKGNEKLADSVNHLLVVGFYLINLGAVCLFLKYGGIAANAQEAIEYLSYKIGIVLVLLGGMHFLNLTIFSKIRQRGIEPPPAPLVRGRPWRLPEAVPVEEQ